jgi:1,4-alpha-glucan branching enzyme
LLLYCPVTAPVYCCCTAATFDPLEIAAPEPGKYRVALDSDAFMFGGEGRVGWDWDHFTSPLETEAEQKKFAGRTQSMKVLCPNRTVIGYAKVPEGW